jgi:hypothetical protein
VLVGVLLCMLLERRLVPLVLICNPLLQRIIWLRLYEEVPDGFKDGLNLGRGFPVLCLEDTQTDIPNSVVGDVGMVDAGDELDVGCFERVVGREGQDEAEDAAVEGGSGGWADGDVPGVQRLGGGEVDGEALWGGLGELAVLLRFGTVSILDCIDE